MEVKKEYKLLGPSHVAARDAKEMAAYWVAGIGAILLAMGLIAATFKSSLSDGWQRYPLMIGTLLEVVAFLFFIFASRQARFTTNTVIIAVLGTAILGLICYLGCFKYYRRPPFDLTNTQMHTFSEQTVKILKGLDGKINVWVMYASRDESWKRFNGQVRDIVDMAKSYTDKLDVTYIDLVVAPRTRKNRAELIGEDPRKLENAIVVFPDGEDLTKVRRTIIPMTKLMDMNVRRASNALPPPAKAEQVLASAIIEVTSTERQVIYFLTGHGEKDINGLGFQAGHMGKIREALEREFMQVRELRLQGGKPVPDDTAALVIAGPTKPLSKKEIKSLERYVVRGGRFFFLIDTDTPESFTKWLYDFCWIQCAPHIIHDARKAKDPQEITVVANPQHEISRPLSGFNVVLPEARPVVRRRGAEKIFDIIPILFSEMHIDLWAESDVASLKEGKIPKFNQEDRDFSSIKARGFRLGLAMEPKNVKKGSKLKPPRFVVIGDADFAENVTNWEKAGDKLLQKNYNEDLFLNVINWLAGREEFISVRPKNPGLAALEFKGRELKMMVAVLGGVPFIVLLIGVMMFFSRRR